MRFIIATILIALLITNTASALDEVYKNLPYEHSMMFGDDWYDTDAKPNISAIIEVDSTFEENEERILQISLTNNGYVKFIERTHDYPDYAYEIKASEMELELEYESTTAKSITAYLEKVSEDEPFEIKSDTATAGILEAGSEVKLYYKIEIDDDAKPGVYPIKLIAKYDYMQDVAVYPTDGESLESENTYSLSYNMTNSTQLLNITIKSKPISDTTYNLFYEIANASIEQLLYITIEQHPDFEIIQTGTTMNAGNTKIINATIKNTGNEVARNSVAHLSVVHPFESIIDDYYLGTLLPNESKKVFFKVKVAKDAIPTNYGINTEIKYENKDGKTKYSDTLKLEVTVEPAISLMQKLEDYKGYLIAFLLMLILILLGFAGFKLVFR